MRTLRSIQVIARRDVLVGAASGAAILGLFGIGGASAQGNGPNGFVVALAKILGDAKPVENRIKFEVPDTAESGNTVPYSVLVDSPMTAADHVKAVHILAAGNPLPGVASFQFTPASGKAQVSSRMRLARSQAVVAVAELSTGQFLIGRRMVKVTIGGCGG